jgi:hypothetical protein
MSRHLSGVIYRILLIVRSYRSKNCNFATIPGTPACLQQQSLLVLSIQRDHSMARFQVALLRSMFAWDFAMGFQSRDWVAATQTYTSLNARVPLLGRFRKTRPVEQPRTIEVGDQIPDTDVEVVQFTGDSSVGVPVSIREVLGDGSCAFVGESQTRNPVPRFRSSSWEAKLSHHHTYHVGARYARSIYTSLLNRAHAWISVVRF